MDFTQFVSMLEEKGLLFTRADLFVDKFEGTMSQPLWDFLERHSDAEQHAALVRLTKGWSFVNCWHMNDCESAAMWKLYSTSNEAVCVQSTYLRLRAVLDEDIHVGKVIYISYDRDKIPAENTFWPLVHKRKSFEYEQELRAIWSNLSDVANSGPAVSSGAEYRPAPMSFVWKRIDLNKLIENVYVSPTSGDWFSALVRRVLRTYGFQLPLQKSDLAAEPLHF